MIKEIGLMKAMETMRKFSRNNIPFSIKFCALNETKKISEGLKEEKNIVLMTGYRRNQSKKSDILVSYYRVNENERRQFYLPLLLEFNRIKIKV